MSQSKTKSAKQASKRSKKQRKQRFEAKRKQKIAAKKAKRKALLKKRRQDLAIQYSCLGNILLHSIKGVIAQHLPQLEQSLNELPDTRKGQTTYSIAELVFAAIMLYTLRMESRHSFNQKRKTAQFQQQYERSFKMRMPHQDTVTAVLQVLDPALLEQLSIDLIKVLLKKRTFHKFRLLNKYFLVSVDATGYSSYDKPPNWPCPHKTSKKGKTCWIQPILCAKIVFPSGLCLPLLTEWIINQEEYDKQDCERAAFKRLAAKLKTHFPRLPICILADGLYPNGPFFDICKANNWSFIVVHKETTLKSVWNQIEEQTPNEQQIDQRLGPGIKRHKSFNWLGGLAYQEHSLNWVQANIERQTAKGNKDKNKFVFLTDLTINPSNVEAIVQAGRLRWVIENQGFNVQKNGGYKLKHKMSRTNFFAIQNFMTCLQIGHLINQLIQHSTCFKEKIQQGFTLKHCWEVLNAFLYYGQIQSLPEGSLNFRYG